MSSFVPTAELVDPRRSLRRDVLYPLGILTAAGVCAFVIWPVLAYRLFSAKFLPHFYCYLGKPGLVWTHVTADTLIAISYFAISATLLYLVYKGRHEIPFHW